MKPKKSYAPQHYQKNKPVKGADYAKKLLWKHIGNRQLSYTFRKEQKVLKYVVDFYSVTLRLAIEIVPSDYVEDVKDRKREEILNDEGVVILRFNENEVKNNINKVLEKIEEYIDANRQNKGPEQGDNF